MALVGPVFLDTSVLLPGILDLSAAGAPAQRILSAVSDRRLRQPHTAWHCCLEFYAVSTRLPEEFRLVPADACRLVEEEIVARFHVHQLPERRRRRFWATAGQEHVRGGRIYDAHIADIAASAGAKIVVTDNRRHFGGLTQRRIQVVGSADFADTAGL